MEVGETLQRKLTKAHQALDLGWLVSQETACPVRSKLSFPGHFLLPLALASAKGVGSFAFFFFSYNSHHGINRTGSSKEEKEEDTLSFFLTCSLVPASLSMSP